MDAEYSRQVDSFRSRVGNCLLAEPSVCFDGHSPEDLEWAESCLVNHPEHLNGDWNSVKDALHEILENKPGSSVSCSDVTMEQTDTRRLIDHPGPMDCVFPVEDEADIFLAQILEGNVSENFIQDSIRPSYDGSTQAETLKDTNLLSSLAKKAMSETSFIRRGNSSSSGLEIDCSTEHVETSIEEDGRQEFLKRLKRALEAVSVHLVPSALGGSAASRDASVDDIIARTRHLSMNRTF